MAVNWQRTLMRVIGAREQAVTVLDVEDVLPWYRRIRFSAPAFMGDLEVFPTVWIRLWVPELDDSSALRQRGYTLVDPDPEAGTFALEFVIHEPTGPAAKWALEAQPGEEVEIAFTPAKLTPDPAIGRFVLLGDSSALPAINSLLDYLPDRARVDLIFSDPHENASELPFRLGPNTQLTLVPGADEQVAALRALAPDLSDTYVWAAGERKAIAAIRGVTRGEWKLPKDRQHTQYYWIEGKPFG